MSGPVLASYVALWVLVVVLSLAVFALYHHFGTMYLTSREGRRSQGPVTGRRLRPTSAETHAGAPVEIPASGSVSLLLFADTRCRSCARMRPEMAGFARERPEVGLVVVCGGTPDVVRTWAAELDGTVPVIPDPGNRITARYQVGITPFAVAVDRTGVVRAHGVASTRAALEAYAEAALNPIEDEEEDEGRETSDESLARMGGHPHQ